mgnify:FL=1
MIPVLEVVVFTTGGVLLALEIIASRVLAPYFGNSIYVWGSLIGVFLGALSVGYYLGGRIADRWPSPAVFSGVVFLAGLLVTPIPLFAPAVLEAIALRDFGPRANPLLAAFILFALPSVVMGAVSPYAVRLRAKSVATMGNVAGRLYALSTMGSIAGTLLAAFVLIQLAGVRMIIHLLGLLLLVLGVVGWLEARRLGAALGAFLVLVLAGALVRAAPADSPTHLVFAKDTVYHRITVTDEGRIRYLKLDNYWQSAIDLDAPLRSVFAYTDYMHLPILFAPHARHALLIGLGGGTIPLQYHASYPQLTMDVVELDPTVADVARRYFSLPKSPRLRIFTQDGRFFVKQARQQYDIILLDAYLIDTIPFHLVTREFFQEVRGRLAPGGVIATNIIGALGGPRSRFFRAAYRTFSSVFPVVYTFPVQWSPGSEEALRNIILVGTTGIARTPEELRRKAASLEREYGNTVGYRFRIMEDLYQGPIRTDDVPVLTDDYAPVDSLLSSP